MTPIIGVIDSAKSGNLATGDFWSIASTVTTGSESTVTFSSIPNTYAHLQLRITFRDTRATTWDSVAMNFNGDAGTNYVYNYLETSGVGTPKVNVDGAGGQTAAYFGYAASASNTTNLYGIAIINILDYTSTNKIKTYLAMGGGSGNDNADIVQFGGYWNSTSAINQISITANTSSNWAANSVFSLYGIKKAV